MNKLPLFAALLLPLAMLKADDKVWKARVTVEAPDGDKTQSICTFLPPADAKLPILLSTSGMCSLVINPLETRDKNGQATNSIDRIKFSIIRQTQLAADSNTFAPIEIYSAVLPVAFGKDIQILRTWEGSVTVRLSGSEDKE